VLAEKIGDFFVWLMGLFGGLGSLVLSQPLWLLVLPGVFLLWRASLALGPNKLCWRCGGKGYVSGWLGGKHGCSSCGSKGYYPRFGAKRK
jgi:hypothetical protein